MIKGKMKRNFNKGFLKGWVLVRSKSSVTLYASSVSPGAARPEDFSRLREVLSGLGEDAQQQANQAIASLENQYDSVESVRAANSAIIEDRDAEIQRLTKQVLELQSINGGVVPFYKVLQIQLPDNRKGYVRSSSDQTFDDTYSNEAFAVEGFFQKEGINLSRTGAAIWNSRTKATLAALVAPRLLRHLPQLVENPASFQGDEPQSLDYKFIFCESIREFIVNCTTHVVLYSQKIGLPPHTTLIDSIQFGKLYGLKLMFQYNIFVLRMMRDFPAGKAQFYPHNGKWVLPFFGYNMEKFIIVSQKGSQSDMNFIQLFDISVNIQPTKRITDYKTAFGEYIPHEEKSLAIQFIFFLEMCSIMRATIAKFDTLYLIINVFCGDIATMRNLIYERSGVQTARTTDLKNIIGYDVTESIFENTTAEQQVTLGETYAFIRSAIEKFRKLHVFEQEPLYPRHLLDKHNGMIAASQFTVCRVNSDTLRSVSECDNTNIWLRNRYMNPLKTEITPGANALFTQDNVNQALDLSLTKGDFGQTSYNSLFDFQATANLPTDHLGLKDQITLPVKSSHQCFAQMYTQAHTLQYAYLSNVFILPIFARYDVRDDVNKVVNLRTVMYLCVNMKTGLFTVLFINTIAKEYINHVSTVLGITDPNCTYDQFQKILETFKITSQIDLPSINEKVEAWRSIREPGEKQVGVTNEIIWFFHDTKFDEIVTT